MRVAVGVCTCGRPNGLRRVLHSLDKQTFKKSAKPIIDWIVVDNKPSAITESVCSDFFKGRSLAYYKEMQKGIPFARNRVLEMVATDTDFLVFIDDDEEASDRWLDELLFVQATCDADIVAGPVSPLFVSFPPDWVVKGKFFELKRFQTGESIFNIYTGNMLIKYPRVMREKIRFNEKFALTGGSDLLLSKRLHLNGWKMVWADDALVYEWVSQERVSARWIVQRRYRHGNVLGLHWRELNPGSHLCERMFFGLEAVGEVIISVKRILCFFFHLNHSKSYFVWVLCRLARAAGILTGLLGSQYREYAYRHKRDDKCLLCA